MLAWITRRGRHNCGALHDRALINHAADRNEGDHENTWPDDPDEVPAWVIRAEAIRMSIGITGCRGAVPYRTRREFEKGCAKAEEAAIRATVGLDETFGDAPKPLSPDEAADRFLSFIRDQTETREYSALEIGAFYSQFCEEANVVPTPENLVKAALALKPGVGRRQIQRTVNGQRQRRWMWYIAPAYEIAPEPGAIEPVVAEADEIVADVIALPLAA